VVRYGTYVWYSEKGRVKTYFLIYLLNSPCCGYMYPRNGQTSSTTITSCTVQWPTRESGVKSSGLTLGIMQAHATTMDVFSNTNHTRTDTAIERINESGLYLLVVVRLCFVHVGYSFAWRSRHECSSIHERSVALTHSSLLVS